MALSVSYTAVSLADIAGELERLAKEAFNRSQLEQNKQKSLFYSGEEAGLMHAAKILRQTTLTLPTEKVK